MHTQMPPLSETETLICVKFTTATHFQHRCAVLMQNCVPWNWHVRLLVLKGVWPQQHTYFFGNELLGWKEEIPLLIIQQMWLQHDSAGKLLRILIYLTQLLVHLSQDLKWKPEHWTILLVLQKRTLENWRKNPTKLLHRHVSTKFIGGKYNFGIVEGQEQAKNI